MNRRATVTCQNLPSEPVMTKALELYVGEDNGHSIQTFTGLFFDLVHPQPHMVRLKDIAEAAAKTNRFTGHTYAPYSIAQHQIWASYEAEREDPRAAPYAFLHDGHESYIGDKATPQKVAEAIIIAEHLGVPVEKVREACKIMAARIDTAIFTRFGLPWPCPPDVWAVVKRVDAKALATEKRDLMPHDRPWQYPLPEPRRFAIHPWPWVKAADEFITRARELGISESV